MKYGYARVSALDQKENFSIEVQTETLQKQGVEQIMIETSTGSSLERPVFTSLLEVLRAGDELYVTRLDRIGRKTSELVPLVLDFERKGVKFVALNLPQPVAGAPSGLLLSIFSWFWEQETIIRAERQRAGIEKAKAAGLYHGRKSIIDEKLKCEVTKLRLSGTPITKISRYLQISRSTVYKVLREIEI